MNMSLPAYRRFPQLAARVVDRIADGLPMLYVAWALPLLLVVAMATPPWQNPDEAAHMLRISQIAHGVLLAYRFDDTTGGATDPNIIASASAMSGVIFHPEKKVSLGMLASAGAAHWGGLTEESFPAIAQYPPILYAPAVLAVEAGRVLRLSVVDSLMLARMANAVGAILVAACALYFARSTRLALAVLLVMPMTVAMFASAAHDGLMIALTLLAIAVVDRAVAEERDLTLPEAVAIGIVTVLVITARPPYLPIAALPLISMRRLRTRAWLTSAVVFAASVAFGAYVLTNISAPLSPAFNPKAQLLYLLQQPWTFLPIAISTLIHAHSDYAVTFIGVLGWLDTFLLPSYYDAAWYVLLLAFASVCAGPTRRVWVPGLIFLAGSAAVLVAGYVSMTPPQADHIEGVQGRYFLPLAAVLAMAVPTWRPLGAILRRPALLAVLGFAAITPAIIVHALLLRFYLTP